MIHAFFLVGELKKITVNEPKDPKKNASAIVLVQYGDIRESTGGPVDFVNAVMIRIPGFKYPQVKDKLRVGSQVQVHGHLQGVLKESLDQGFFTTELVADRVHVDGERNTEKG